MKHFVSLILACGIVPAADAQIPITAASPVYFQDFNTLDTGNANTNNLPSGWRISENGSSTTTVNGQYKGNNGSSATGETYSYGAAGSGDRALGGLASASIQTHFGAAFVNNTGAAIGAMTVSYRAEQWRAGDTAQRPDSLRFFYSLTATDVDSSLTGWTEVVTLMANSAQLQGSGQLNGNAVFNIVSGTVNVAVPDAAQLRIKWVDKNIGGVDDGLAIDSLTVSFVPAVPNLRPVISSLSPADGVTGVQPTLSSLQMIFNKPVTKSSGTIHLHNATAGTTQMIGVTSTNVTVAGSTVTVSGVMLATAANYYVMVDSTAFDSAGNHFVGIYDQTIWNFNTASTAVLTVAASKLGLAILGRATTGRIPIGFYADKSEEFTLSLFDMSGREIIRQTMRTNAGENQIVLSPRGLVAGQYILRVNCANSAGSVKVAVE